MDNQLPSLLATDIVYPYGTYRDREYPAMDTELNIRCGGRFMSVEIVDMSSSRLIHTPPSHRMSSLDIGAGTCRYHTIGVPRIGVPTSSCGGSRQVESRQWALGRTRRTGTRIYYKK